MSDATDNTLPPAVLALASLAAFVAANHPKKGLCQLEILRKHKVPQAHIDLVLDIARHLRDEAGQIIDSEFDAVYAADANVAVPATSGGSCCTPTAKGNACC
jgi:hypothetical protein